MNIKPSKLTMSALRHHATVYPHPEGVDHLNAYLDAWREPLDLDAGLTAMNALVQSEALWKQDPEWRALHGAWLRGWLALMMAHGVLIHLDWRTGNAEPAPTQPALERFFERSGAEPITLTITNTGSRPVEEEP